MYKEEWIKRAADHGAIAAMKIIWLQWDMHVYVVNKFYNVLFRWNEIMYKHMISRIVV